MNKIILIFLLGFGFSCSSQQKSNEKKTFTKENEILISMDENANTLLKDSKAYSVSIGIVKDGKTYTKHYGEIDKGKGNKATNETLFEIASVTKVFTGTLMAKAVLEGKTNLGDDIRKYLTEEYPNLEYQGNPIKIRDLLSHKTGIFRQFPDYGELLKNFNDSTAFKIQKNENSYSKEQFFAELKIVKLDTLPGTVYKYTNLGTELSAHILENMYHKSYETLLNEVILERSGMKSTKIHLDKNDLLANGYNDSGLLMPHMSDKLWGAAGMMKSTMNDLIQFMKFELDAKNKIVMESHRKIAQANGDWMGYFWDIHVDSEGNVSYWKHGGAYGTQNMFIVYPEYNLGISIIVNISDQNTFSNLYEARQGLEDDLKPFGKKSIGRAIKKKCIENIDEGIAYYHQLKEKNSKQYNFSDESELNNLGYKLLKSEKIVSAVKIFKLLVSEFPDSGNPYDSLGEAYFNNKEYESSKQNYQKSLELNPNNGNAKEMIKKIEEKIKV